jgi:threonylcarbamoyladenosine tRNA methylthiotransferase CDKAL1
MKDIEDTTPQVGASGAQNLLTVNPRENPRRQREKHGDDVPGDATIFVHTFGCGHNVSDGEYMAGQLVDRGYRITDDFKSADCFLINSCTVKNPSEDHFVTLVRRAKESGKPVVVAGCVPQGDPTGKEWSDVSVIGVKQIHQAASVVEEALRGNIVRAMGDDEASPAGRPLAVREKTSLKSQDIEVMPLPRLDLPKVRRNNFIEIIPINVGCFNNCTYCKTKQARGDLQSWPVQEIVSRVRQVVLEGVREIRLTSEDVGAYGIDIGTDIVHLLLAIAKEVEHTDVMIRVGMSNPPYLLRHVAAVAELLKHKNFFEFIHIPVQSGSNVILDAMKREYTVEEFLECVEGFRAALPNISIATDIICAFPGEGELEWEDTMSLCRRVQFPVVNISRYYARRGTPAAGMPQIRTDIAKKRTVELTNFFNSYETYGQAVGTKHWIWLLEVAHDKHHLVGHTKTFVQVLVDPCEASLGDYVQVKITASTKYSVQGVVLERVRPTKDGKGLERIGKSRAPTRYLFAAASVAFISIAAVMMLRRKR